MNSSAKHDFLPTATWDALKLRAQLARQLRSFFDNYGFVEVETPLLSRDVVADRHLDPIPVTLPQVPPTPLAPQQMWLQTSPEFGMKRLLASGADQIYQITKAFRAGERGAWHNPEFTMVEWYRVGDDMKAGMEFLAKLAGFVFPNRRVRLVSYQEAFKGTLFLDPHTATVEQLKECVRRNSLRAPSSLEDDRDQWLNFLLACLVERELEGVVLLYDYPGTQAALARTRTVPGSPSYEVAERFELYVDGVELANGYHELLDADILRARNKLANEQRLADSRYAVPTESRLLDAMDHGLPPCSGVALGFDRLVMLVGGWTQIHEVMPFPVERA